MYREIACKTLVGKGKVENLITKEIKLEESVSQTLGCWIINLENEMQFVNDDLYIIGSFDIQLWYALNNDKQSKVFQEKVDFKEKVNMSYRDIKIIDNQRFPKIYVNKYPTCKDMKINMDGSISLEIEYIFYVDVFQEALLVVNCSSNYEEDIPLDEEIILNVNENYLIDKK